MAIVLGDGPADDTLLTLARLGLGGPQIDGWWFPHSPLPRHRPHADRRRRRAAGTARAGAQKFSWVHIDDVVGAVRFLRDRDDIAGPVNIASPQPSDNRTLMRELRRAVGMPSGCPPGAGCWNRRCGCSAPSPSSC